MTGPIKGPYRIGPTGSNEFERFVIATAPDGSALYVAAVRTPLQSDGAKYDAEARDATARLLAASWEMMEVCRMIIGAVEDGAEMAVVEAARAALSKAVGVS